MMPAPVAALHLLVEGDGSSAQRQQKSEAGFSAGLKRPIPLSQC
jgi:hypothetical protein